LYVINELIKYHKLKILHIGLSAERIVYRLTMLL